MVDKTNDTLSLRDLYKVLFKHKASIMILFMAVVITVIAAVYILPETYEARSSILVKIGRENVSIPGMSPSNQQTIFTTGVRKQDIDSEIELLTNNFIITKVVNKLGTDFLYPAGVKPESFLKLIMYYFKLTLKGARDLVYEMLYKLDLMTKLSDHESAVSSIQEKLVAEQLRDADVIEVRLKWFHPDIATETLETLIEFYLEFHLYTHQSSEGERFFLNQVEIIEKRLNDSEERMRSLKKNEGITSFEEQRLFLLAQVNNTRAGLYETETEIGMLLAEIKELKAQMDSLINRITPGFERAYKTAENELLLQEVKLPPTREKKRILENHLQSYQNDLDRLNQFDVELNRLQRQIQIDEEHYILYRKRLEEARIMNVLDAERIVNIKVVDPASASNVPVKPKKLFMIGIAIILSLVLAVGFAFISEYLDHSINTAEDVKKYLNVPLLATIRDSN